MDLEQTIEKPTGTEKKKVIFPCEDVRVKNRRKLEDLKENLFFFCATSLLKGISTQKKLSQHRTIGQLQTTQDIKVRMFLVIVYQSYSCLNESSWLLLSIIYFDGRKHFLAWIRPNLLWRYCKDFIMVINIRRSLQRIE